MNSSTFRKSAISIVIGLLFGAGVTAVTLALFSAIFTKFDLKESLVLPLSLTSILLGAFVAGFISAKLYEKNGLIIGGITGYFMFIVITVISLLGNSDNFTYITLLKLIFTVIPAIIGGVVGVNIRKSNKLLNMMNK